MSVEKASGVGTRGARNASERLSLVERVLLLNPLLRIGIETEKTAGPSGGVLVPLLLLIAATTPAFAVGPIIRLGLYDAPYTDNAGVQVSNLADAKGNFATGYSNRYTGATTYPGIAVWVADGASGMTTRIGFFDSDYTQSGGAENGYQYSYQYSNTNLLQDAYVAGYSQKYNGTSPLGQAAWVADAASGITTRVGFFDSSYTQIGGSENGYQQSKVGFLQGGYAAGNSWKYNGTTALGGAAWVADASSGVTTRVGLIGSEYTQSSGSLSGYQYSEVSFLQDGYVAGNSSKWSGFNYFGQASWVANAASGVTTRVGLLSGEYTQNGEQYSSVSFLQGSYVAGYSQKYNATTTLGQAAWVADVINGVTIRAGLFDSAYTQTGGSQSGYQDSSVSLLQGGFAAGLSQKYSGTIALGQAAWVADAASGLTIRVGFFDSAYTQSGGSKSGYQDSSVSFLQGGFAAGVSLKYNGTTALGRAAWVADSTIGLTTRVGLFDSAYTQTGGSQSGFQYGFVTYLENARAAGISRKYSGTTALGQAAWVADAASGATTRVGLFSSAYTQSGGTQNGYQYSVFTFLEGDYASGYSLKYNGTTALGQTAWVYDLDDGVMSPIILSMRASDGYANSVINRLYDTGLAVGTYLLFSDTGANLGYRAFIWTPIDGPHDLGSLIPSGLSAAGWDKLYNAYYGDPVSSVFYGYGDLPGDASGTQAVYEAYTAAPEPSSALLLLTGVALLACRRK